MIESSSRAALAPLMRSFDNSRRVLLHLLERAAEFHCHIRITDLCGGTAAETLLHPDCEPWVAHSDIRQARTLASLICSSESAIDAYLMFGSPRPRR
jgi:hypothetical protein